MTAASVAALTVYDMVKGVERGVTIGGVRLVSKSGGKSGDWVRHDPPGHEDVAGASAARPDGARAAGRIAKPARPGGRQRRQAAGMRRALVITASDRVSAGRPRGRLRGSGSGSGSRPSASPSSARSCRTSRRCSPRSCARRPKAHDLIVTTGGTGLTPRDVTPQATRDAIDYEVPGLAEAMRAAGRASTPFADLSRGVVGVIGRALVVNLPGSPRGRAGVAGGDRGRARPRARDAGRAVRPRRAARRAEPRRRGVPARDAVRALRRRPALPARLPAVLGRGRLLLPRDGAPPAGVRRGPRRGSQPVRRRPAPVRRADPVRVHPDQDVQGRPGGADARRHLLGLRAPDDRHRQHRHRRAHRAGPVDPVRRAALDADQRDAERRRGHRPGVDRRGRSSAGS